MKFYFIIYMYKRDTRKKDNTFRDSVIFTNQQKLITEHPLKWQQEVNEKYQPKHPYPGGFESETYIVLNWKELSEDEYNRFKDAIG